MPIAKGANLSAILPTPISGTKLIASSPGHSQILKIGRRPGTNTTSLTGNGGLSFVMMATCPRNMRPSVEAQSQG